MCIAAPHTKLSGSSSLAVQLEGLQGLVEDAGEDEEMKRMAREERGALLEQVGGWGWGGGVGVGGGGGVGGAAGGGAPD